MSADHKPPLQSRIRLSDGYAVTVTEHTERGFRYKGEARPFLSREGSWFTGEGEVFTDTPEYRLGHWGFTLIGADEPDYVPSPCGVFTCPPIEPVCFSVPAIKVEQIRDLANSILSPTVTYSRDPFEMARRAVEANANAAAEIIDLLRPYST